MAWSRVNKKTKKPIKWWIYKTLCEISWKLGDRNYYYHKYLSLCVKQGYNLYGDKV